METLGVGPGDQLELNEGPDGFTIRPRPINYSRLGTLGSKIPPGHPPFDIATFRKQPYDSIFGDLTSRLRLTGSRILLNWTSYTDRSGRTCSIVGADFEYVK